MAISSDLLITIVQTLEQHSEAIRIKKLIFSLSKKYWENDLTIINQFSLSELLQALIESTPTRDELIIAINTLIKSLNRAQLYVPLAQLLIEEITIFYPQNGQGSAQIILSQGNLEQNTDNLKLEKIVEQVASTLFYHAEENRIKKLLLSVNSDRWENRPNPINQDEFQRLILNIYQTYATSSDLQIALTRIVEKINKSTVYRTIAHIILKAFDPLYRKTALNPSNSNLTPASHQEAPPRLENQIVPSSTLPEHQNPKAEPELSTDAAKSLTKTYDRFELRQMIMQYTNPLRAKILIFSVMVSPWNVNHPDWSRLRSQTLDNLVEQLIASGMELTEINIKLQAVAKVFPETNDSLQSASTIIDAIKPFVSDDGSEGSEPRKTV